MNTDGREGRESAGEEGEEKASQRMRWREQDQDSNKIY